MEQAYISWRNGRDLLPTQSTGQNNAPADNKAASKIKDQATTTSGRRRGKRAGRRGRSGGNNKNPQQLAFTGQDQIQEPTEFPATTLAEREAAATHFWTNVTPATLFGFPSNAETPATNLANETRNRSTAEPLLPTDYYQEINRPVEEDESPFDPDSSFSRTAAILSGFVERCEDVGKKRKDWVRERYVYVDDNVQPVFKDKERKRSNKNPISDQNEDQKELIPNGMKKWEWYDNNNSGGTGYNHGGLQDTGEFYHKPAPRLNNFNPEAIVFEPRCKPDGDCSPSARIRRTR